jgi:tetratricopeptide (TPR) repeat protein
VRALKNKNATAALDMAAKAEKLNPGFYQNSFLAGRALLALHRSQEAAQSFEKALAEHPAFLKEQQELESLLQHTKNPK